MNDTDLRALGRLHSASEAMAAVAMASMIFERYSFDLIYARPRQTPAAWAAELEEAIGRAAEHLSLYQLTIEAGTMFERLRDAGKLVVPDAETARVLYDVTREICEKHGLPGYEISNHARPGAECRHNLVYWRYGEYAGVGPGAHARLATGTGRFALSTELVPEAWLARVEEQGHGVVEAERLSAEAEGDEFLLMGLRLSEGIDPARYTLLSGRVLDERRIQSLLQDNLVESAGDGRLRVSREGFPVLDAIVADLAA
jgi:oxygen-independent coproporphyrinogen-3 oxidase